MTGPRHADRPEHTVNPDELEVAPGFAHETLQGWIPELATEDELREALEKAFDYRGDVTITRKDGSKLEGYIFDRVTGSHAGNLFCAPSAQRLQSAAENRLFGYCRTGLFGSGHRRREELGGLGEEVLGQEGNGRGNAEPAARVTGRVASFAIKSG